MVLLAVDTLEQERIMELHDRRKTLALNELGAEDVQRQRRRTTRVRCQARVELQRADRTLVGACTDLSLGGMLFLGPLVSVGHKVNLSIDLSGLGTVRVQGEVVGHRQPSNGRGMAIRFLSLTQCDLKVISRFVADQRV